MLKVSHPSNSSLTKIYRAKIQVFYQIRLQRAKFMLQSNFINGLKRFKTVKIETNVNLIGQIKAQIPQFELTARLATLKLVTNRIFTAHEKCQQMV